MKSILSCILCLCLLAGCVACTKPAKEQETTKATSSAPVETTTQAPEETTTTAPQEEETTTKLPADLPLSYDQGGFPNPSEDDETKRY